MGHTPYRAAAILTAVLFTGVAWGQPSISGVTNAASYAHPSLPNGSIAQGSMFIVFGSNMGPANLVQAQTLPLRTTLGNTSIQVTVGGTTVDAYMIYSLASQVAAILPSPTPTGAGKITVKYNGATSAAADITVVQASFGIFTRNQAGSGPAIVQNYAGPNDAPPTNAVFEAANPGQVITIWGTGLGAVSTGDSGDPPAPVENLPTEVEVLIGSKRVQQPLIYKGRAYLLPGIDQINVTIPDDVETGCYVPLAVRAGGITSNYGSISIAPSGKTCSEPATGYTAADIERAVQSGSIRMGGIALSRSRIRLPFSIPGMPLDMKTDAGSASFVRYDPVTLAASRSGFGSVSPFGSCVVYTFAGDTPDTADPVKGVGLEAGASLTVTGPQGSKQLPRVAAGAYSAQLGGGFQAEYLAPGSYTVAGPGGADVDSFTANLQVPNPLVWSNADQVNSVNRSQNLTVNWTGGGADQYVVIMGYSAGTQAGAMFLCTERASRGTFTVDSAVLSALPPSHVEDEIPIGALALTTGTLGDSGKFQAEGLDFGYITYTDTDMKTVKYE